MTATRPRPFVTRTEATSAWCNPKSGSRGPASTPSSTATSPACAQRKGTSSGGSCSAAGGPAPTRVQQRSPGPAGARSPRHAGQARWRAPLSPRCWPTVIQCRRTSSSSRGTLPTSRPAASRSAGRPGFTDQAPTPRPGALDEQVRRGRRRPAGSSRWRRPSSPARRPADGRCRPAAPKKRRSGSGPCRDMLLIRTPVRLQRQSVRPVERRC